MNRKAQSLSLVRRPRRLRSSSAIRDMIREVHVRPEHLILPLFVTEKSEGSKPISSMPGVSQHDLEGLLSEVRAAVALGIRSVLLFGIPAEKDACGTQAYAENGIVPQAVRKLKAAFPELVVVTDVCLCEYTDHGHCGVLEGHEVANDATVDLLVKEALAHASAGADIVAPSDMMDGRIGAIRDALDAAGFEKVIIMSYAAKYCSAFYGPFREAAESAPQFGDRRGYQMDPANSREALREVELDVEEGADIVMVKPGLPYLDIVRDIRQAFDLPLAVYNVSGEYSAVKAAAQNGWLDEKRAVMEMMTAFRRAGADLIITYWAKEVAAWCAEQR